MTKYSSRSAGKHAIWGGRFGDVRQNRPNTTMQDINSSIDFDRRLASEDIEASKAHAQMLAACEIISGSDRDNILRGLEQISSEITAGKCTWSPELEDIHMNIEARLQTLIGEAAGRLHTARSRNDQVATDFRIWVRKSCKQSRKQIHALIKTLVQRAEEEADTILPGLTHLQNAQPITLGHHFLAYAEMLWRDQKRFKDACKRMNECPLGSGALAGTSFPVNRCMTAEILKFDRPMRNSLDAVSSRDFAAEALAAAAICSGNLSRMAEEIILWASSPFSFVQLPDSWSTGSSMMPQKRNPDAAELVRAKSARISSSLSGLLTMLKALPLAYSKDMQEDKPYLFEAFDALELSLQAMNGMIAEIIPDKNAMRQSAEHGFTTATDLADWLTRELKLPFRQAHHIAGNAVREAEKIQENLVNLPLETLQKLEPRIHAGVYSVLNVQDSIKSRNSYGGTAPDNVREQIKLWHKRLHK